MISFDSLTEEQKEKVLEIADKEPLFIDDLGWLVSSKVWQGAQCCIDPKEVKQWLNYIKWQNSKTIKKQ